MEEDNLNEIKICVNENTKYDSNDMFDKRLNLSVSTWMLLYKNLLTLDSRAKLRIASTSIAHTFRHDKTIISQHGTFATKFELSVPYNFFLSTVDQLKESAEQPFSVSFHEILDYTEGEIVDSLHLNYMVELLWIVTEYMLAGQDPKMTILYGTLVDPQYVYDIPFNVNLVKVEMPQYGSHHSKISILKYKDKSVRIIISTANYYYLDWRTRTQGLWISPILPHLPDDAEDTDGESVTNFKKDFIAYLSIYKESDVYDWRALMEKIDFSAVKVFFLASVPGNYTGSEADLYGHKRLSTILSEHANLSYTASLWPIVAQSSAIGVFGKEYQGWLQNNIAYPMAQANNENITFIPEFKFIYPSKANYSQSFDSQIDTPCLMYNEENHRKQPWIKSFLHKWRSDKSGRSKAMPHCKCYTRISPDGTEISWFILTSANVSKGAWGKLLRGGVCSIANYEAGVVFIPDIMINKATFPIKKIENNEAPVFLLPYDLPLTLYGAEDEPFVIAKFNDLVPNIQQPKVQEKFLDNTSVEDIASQLQALKAEDQRIKIQANQLTLELNKNKKIEITEQSENLLQIEDTTEGKNQNIDKIDKDIEDTSDISSEAELEENSCGHNLFASL